ncbi:MAG: hypothetical protein AB8E82_11625 [Aureispira sp.]
MHTFLQGDFIVYGIPPWDSVITLWKSKTGGDSAVMTVQAIGEPSKDGYLLLYGTYFTKLPDEPLANYMVSIEQISRDTLVLWKYNCREFTLKEMLDKTIEKEVDLKEYISKRRKERYGTYVKQHNTRFNYRLSRRKNIYSGSDLSKQFREIAGYVAMDMIEMKSAQFTKDGALTREIYNYHVRRHHLDLRKWCALVEED